MKTRLAWLIPALLVLASCAQVTSTRGTSFVDPDHGGMILSSVIVDARSDRLGERESIERSAAATLQRAGINATASLDVLPPTRDTGEQIRRRAIMNTGAQTVLEIIPREKQIVRSFIPGSHYGPYDRWHHNRYRDPFYEPSLVLEEPVARYDVTLYELPRYDALWTADLTTRGPTGMSFEQVGANFARELVERMAHDGLVLHPDTHF